MSFDSAEHPRNLLDGRFTTATHQEAGVTVAPLPISLEPGEIEDYSELADGEVIHSLNVRRSDEGSYTVHPAVSLNMADILSADLLRTSEPGAAAFRERNEAMIHDFLENRYEAEVAVDDEGMLTLEFTADLPNPTEAAAADAAWNGTKITALHNESDHGTFGSENLGRLIADKAAATVTVPDRLGARGAAMRMREEEIDTEVSLAMGVREISDATALAIAGRLGGGDRIAYPELNRLAVRGYADAEALHGELRALYWENSYGRRGDRVNMMFSWALHGGSSPHAAAA